MCLYALPLLVLLLAPPSFSRPENTLVLTYTQGDDTIQYYSNGRDVIYAYFSATGEIVDCEIGKLNGSASLFEEALSDRPQKSQYITLDMRRLARQCRRYLRKMLRIEEDGSPKIRMMKERIKLHMGYPGTRWCKTNPSAEGGSDDTTEGPDQCCHALHTCEDVITAAGQHLGVYNYYPWPIYSCACTEAFQKCLLNTTSPVAAEVGHIYFNVVKVRCFVEEEIERCVKWNPWFTECTQSHNMNTARLTDTSPFEVTTD